MIAWQGRAAASEGGHDQLSRTRSAQAGAGPTTTSDGILDGYCYFAVNSLIGPTLGNYTDLCQLLMAMFSLMLGLIERRQWLVLGIDVKRLGDPFTNELTTFKYK